MGGYALPIPSRPAPLSAGRHTSDERLARLVANGSARAFALLYQRHHQALYRYCRLILRDEHEAQDALQSAMTRAFVALRARERELAVRPWLFRIAHNEAVSILRRRRPTTPLTEALEPAELTVERTLEGRERLAALLADLQALTERQRAALVMRELSGLSIEELAGALATTPGAAKQLLFEARGALHDFAEGRAMECERIREAISADDGRALRGRKLRAHLRACADCREFRAAIAARGADLRALAPPLAGLPAAALLGRVLAHGAAGAHAGGLAIGSGAAAGGSAGASALGTSSLSTSSLGTSAVGTAPLGASSAGVSLAAKALVCVAAAATVAGGARLALVDARHGHSHGASRAHAAYDGAARAPTSTRIAAARAGGGGRGAAVSASSSGHHAPAAAGGAGASDGAAARGAATGAPSTTRSADRAKAGGGRGHGAGGAGRTGASTRARGGARGATGRRGAGHSNSHAGRAENENGRDLRVRREQAKRAPRRAETGPQNATHRARGGTRNPKRRRRRTPMRKARGRTQRGAPRAPTRRPARHPRPQNGPRAPAVVPDLRRAEAL
jgi:RNA polymerase sigma factor (sigma-70 family)